MFNAFKKFLCACMAALMLLSMMPAQAVTYAQSKVYIIANTLNAYKKADTSSKVLGVMTYGEDMTMLAFSGGWVRIKNDKGQIGYCKLSGLSTQNPNTLNELVYAKADKTPVYQKANASSKKLAYVKQSAALNVVAKTADGKWLRVKNGSVYGYVSTDRVSAEPLASHGAITRTVYVVSENASTVTSGMGSGKSMGNISHGQSYTLLGTSGNYAKVRNSKGKVGYCRKELLSTDNPNNMNETMYAQVSGNILYSNSIIKGTGKRINRGTQVTVVAETPEGGWYRVKYGGKYYYVKSILLDTINSPDNGREVYSLIDTTLYAKASYSSKKVGTVEENEALRLVGVSKQGAKVKTADGVTGYLPIDLLEPFAWTFSVSNIW